jgi:FkbM family methyltransferase
LVPETHLSEPDIPTVVIDAGGRYGLHPTWKPFRGELKYVLFEPDPSEAQRLAGKYSRRSDEVTVEQKALADRPGTLTLNLMRNRAMSSSSVRNPISASFKDERLAEVEVVERVEAISTTIDDYARQHSLSVDFLKLDTEGNELAILEGAQEQLVSNIIGIRSEVSFDRTFEGMPLFGELNAFVMDREFFLVNFDYDGRGEYQNEFAPSNARYGVLGCCDAVWLRRQTAILNEAGATVERLAMRALKYAGFALLNHAPDLAIDVLLRARRDHGISFTGLASSRLYRAVDVGVQKLMYSLKWQPGLSLRRSEAVYAEIFEREMKKMNDFMQSEELNPD